MRQSFRSCRQHGPLADCGRRSVLQVMRSSWTASISGIRSGSGTVASPAHIGRSGRCGEADRKVPWPVDRGCHIVSATAWCRAGIDPKARHADIVNDVSLHSQREPASRRSLNSTGLSIREGKVSAVFCGNQPRGKEIVAPLDRAGRVRTGRGSSLTSLSAAVSSVQHQAIAARRQLNMPSALRRALKDATPRQDCLLLPKNRRLARESARHPGCLRSCFRVALPQRGRRCRLPGTVPGTSREDPASALSGSSKPAESADPRRHLDRTPSARVR
jgi:hypothetical protein